MWNVRRISGCEYEQLNALARRDSPSPPCVVVVVVKLFYTRVVDAMTSFARACVYRSHLLRALRCVLRPAGAKQIPAGKLRVSVIAVIPLGEAAAAAAAAARFE